MTHSPLPWDYEDFTEVKEEYPHWTQPSYINGGFMIFSPTCDDHPVADCSCNHTCRDANECEANAAFIVKAVNAHDKLVEALRAFVDKIDPVCLSESDHPQVDFIEEYLAGLDVLKGLE